MPISALVKLFAIDQLAAHESAPRPGAYHSAAIAPSRTTTTPCVFRPSWNAYARDQFIVYSSMPTSPGDTTSQSEPGSNGPAGTDPASASPPTEASPTISEPTTHLEN